MPKLSPTAAKPGHSEKVAGGGGAGAIGHHVPMVGMVGAATTGPEARPHASGMVDMPNRATPCNMFA